MSKQVVSELQAGLLAIAFCVVVGGGLWLTGDSGKLWLQNTTKRISRTNQVVPVQVAVERCAEKGTKDLAFYQCMADLGWYTMGDGWERME